ncbi:alpha/beta hydrolase fold domain-containing protein [Shivajiella indica]|uniref:Alpha/beta hydrolase fold domain-containing protein n=1 Tax=Shivajiella indica TaxID=872115 RepID=A0ABW5BBK9_9BACT
MKYKHTLTPSFLSKLLQFIMLITGRRSKLEKAIRIQRFNEHAAPVPNHIKRNCIVEKREIAGRVVWFLEPKQKLSGKVLLYLHGGAYVNNMVSFHWDLIGTIGKEIGALIVVADYPLAPKANYLDTYAFMDVLYSDLLRKYNAEELVLMGDSAGGGLALGYAQKLVQEKKALPSQLVLLSPWLDVTMSNPEIQEVQPKDKMLEIDGLILCGKAYAGDADTSYLWISPIYGSMDGLPRISMFMGTHDLLWPDGKKLCHLLEKKGVEFDYFEYPEMFHVWMVITKLPESKAVVHQIGKMLRKD